MTPKSFSYGLYAYLDARRAEPEESAYTLQLFDTRYGILNRLYTRGVTILILVLVIVSSVDGTVIDNFRLVEMV